MELVLPKLSEDLVLKCRLISKNWKSVVDNYMENHLSSIPYNDSTHRIAENLPHYRDFSKMFRTKLYGLDDILKFSADIGNSPSGNPVVGRHLYISTLTQDSANGTDDNQFTAIVDSICLLLDKIGTFIWCFELKIKLKNLTVERYYAELCRCLRLLPNLKTLKLNGRVTDTCTEEIMSLLLNNNALPMLTSLTGLEFNIHGVPLQLEETFYKTYGQSLTKFAYTIDPLHVGSMWHVQGALKFHHFFTKLREFHLKGLESLLLSLQILCAVGTFNENLQKFVGTLTTTKNEFHVLNFLNGFRGFNITVVRIPTGRLIGGAEINQFKPLENIRTLELVDCDKLDYTFLKKLTNLEYLYIHQDVMVALNRRYPSFLKMADAGLSVLVRDCLYSKVAPPTSFWEMVSKLKCLYTADGGEYNMGTFYSPFLCYSRV